MLIVVVIFATVAAGLLIFAQATKANGRRDEHDARAERYRIRARDWWVLNWLWGNRAQKRLTDQRSTWE